MHKKAIALLISMCLVRLCICAPVGGGISSVAEEDGTPTVYPYKLIFTNGTVTDNGDGTATVTVTGGGTLYGAISVTIDGGGSAITTGVKGYARIPYAGTITKVTVLADQSGSIVVDVWKDTYANYPPTVADTITASAKPTLSTATKAEDATLTGWTKTITAGDVIGINVDSATTVTRVQLLIEVTKT